MTNYQVEVTYIMVNGSRAKTSIHVSATSASDAERQASNRVTGTVISAVAKKLR
ncbi:hypothetical protein [Fusobacterium russii]|uniref:hypothetical protein n=1 Tax=Fusobacterium russii TaxID=854 RepID=UPI00039C432D|nr:hypothetical protein [Fusobacterium russii]